MHFMVSCMFFIIGPQKVIMVEYTITSYDTDEDKIKRFNFTDVMGLDPPSIKQLQGSVTSFS